MPLVLASGSPYRAALLDRFGLRFEICTSDFDETPRDGEAPQALVQRLSLGKAEAVAKTRSSALVIGADQIAVLDEQILGKPGTRERAIAQLQQMSGRAVHYLSGMALIGPGIRRVEIVPTVLKFRVLSRPEIERYVERDQPLDCAGAMRSEALGCTLLEYLRSDDPTALIGLPLIRLAEWLREAGFELP
ncbi:MAG: septum formation protein Maf [Gammaproteobacteria bacterium HGW-Gammaproteobacteria-8]|nr:MAG: septum formation protein Maf [Gammaproteobacteria bacterium HGW-Gammaproteobacteria-8]